METYEQKLGLPNRIKGGSMKFEETLIRIIESYFLIQKPINAYYSEASVQHKLAIEIYKQLKKVDPIVEYKIQRKKEYLDIFCKHKGIRYGIELKYKTRKVESTDFDYTTQGAQNNGKYDFFRDVSRIERFIDKDYIDEGYVFFITNDQRYYNPARNNTKVKKFDLIDGTILHGRYTPKWKGRKKVLTIEGKYFICWHKPVHKKGNRVATFSFCKVKVTGRA